MRQIALTLYSGSTFFFFLVLCQKNECFLGEMFVNDSALMYLRWSMSEQGKQTKQKSHYVSSFTFPRSKKRGEQ